MRAYELTGQAKIEGIQTYIHYLIQSKCKFVFFAHHKKVLDAAEKVAKEEKIEYMRIDGSTGAQQRHDNVQAFQNDKNVQIAILSITACATGLTLTAASTVVFSELYFTPAVMIQAEDRCHRIGQGASSVNIHYLYGEGTCDNIIFRLLTSKFEVVKKTLDKEDEKMNINKEKGFGTISMGNKLHREKKRDSLFDLPQKERKSSEKKEIAVEFVPEKDIMSLEDIYREAELEFYLNK